MKKLIIGLVVVSLSILFMTGCTKENDKNKESQMDADIVRKWTEVEKEYQKIEEKAEIKLNDIHEITKADIENVVRTIEEKYEEVQNGITKKNENVAKELYEAGHQLEILTEKSSKLASHEIVKLGIDVKNFVKRYYGEVGEEVEIIKENIEGRFDHVKKLTEDEWNKFLSLLKK